MTRNTADDSPVDASWVSSNSIGFWHCTWRLHIPQVEGSVPQNSPNFRCQSQAPGCSLCFWPTGYHSHHAFLCFDSLPEHLQRTQGNTCLHSPLILKDITKDTQMNSQMEEVHRCGWRDKESPCSFLASHPPGTSMQFIYLEVSRTQSFRVVKKASLCRYHWSLVYQLQTSDHWSLVYQLKLQLLEVAEGIWKS